MSVPKVDRDSGWATTCSTASTTRGTPFMDIDCPAAPQRSSRHRLQVLSPNPITYFHHIEADVATNFCRWHNDEMATAVTAQPDRLRRLRPTPDAGHRRRGERAASRRRRTLGLLGRLHRHRLRHHVRRRTARRLVGDGRRARRARVHPSRAVGHRRTAARRTDPQVRPRPVAWIPVRRDAGCRVPDLRRRSRPLPHPRHLPVARRWRLRLHGRPSRTPGPRPTVGTRRPGRFRKAGCDGCGSTITSTTTTR